MPALLLLLTILTAPAVPPNAPSVVEGRGAVECRLRIGAAGVPLVRVDSTPHRSAWFVVDTGATGTTMHSDLARSLGLEEAGRVRITTIDGSASVSTVRLRRFGIAGVATRHDLDVAVHDLALVRRAAPEADGILGQDVLAQYDYLIDFSRQRLTVGRFAPPARGRRVPLSWSEGRPVLQVSGGPVGQGLVLDTGADVLVMEATAARLAIGDAPPAGRTRALLQTHAGSRTVDVEHHLGLRMANVDLPPVALVRLPDDAWQMAPEVGLLPASLFSRVYVSARTGEAVVWAK